MVDTHPGYSLEQTRFSLDSLNLIYRQFRHNQEDTFLMDIQTFQSLILLNMQAQGGILPNVWRFVPFDAIIKLAAKLEAVPLSDSQTDQKSFQLFKRKTNDMEFLEGRKFMNWRKAILIFALMSGRLPSEAEK